MKLDLDERGLDMINTEIQSIPVQAANERLVADAFAVDLFEMMGHYALVQAISAFALSALGDALTTHGRVDVPAVVKNEGLVHRHALGLMRYLATQGLMIEEDDQVFTSTFRGRAILSQISLGFLQFYHLGYGELMRRSGELIRGDIEYEKDVVRHPYWVAEASCMITNKLIDDVPYEVMRRKGARVVADLGCGSGHFLIELARREPDIRAVGIDIAESAIAAAERGATAAGVSDRVSFVVGDCFDLTTVAAIVGEVDVFYSFALEHEGLRRGEEFVLKHIEQMGELFPGKTYLQGEPLLNMTATDGVFYWIHMLSMQGLPRNIPGWCELLSKLRGCQLERVYVPSHGVIGAVFEITLGTDPS